MSNPLHEALRRQSKLAFRRVRPGAELIKRLQLLPDNLRSDESLQRLSAWLVVPFSLWPVDIIGLAEHLIALAEQGKRPASEFQALIALLGNPPTEETCDVICEHEHLVKGGSYESLIEAQHKFDAKEARLLKDPAFLADWQWIKKHFDITKHQSDSGVIRRRMVSERNFRPDNWNFSWRSKRDRFENVFDAFCHKWTLYGMERDKPLLQKLSVNITPYGTMIVIPRYWSFDYNRDLKWRSVTRLHHSRDVPRQGAKLEANESARRALAAKARRFIAEAKRLGMKGDARDYWVMEKVGMSDSDPRQLRRLLKVK
ncbi:MAG: hypothetical protein L0Y58_18235 [Verrucomicrobia subdivision 3 bacterium]|nr:hypothetical protein [Limisphaerales bacterium]